MGVAATIEHDKLPLEYSYRSVIDVGANRGQFALYARARFPMADVYSLEPLAQPWRRLERMFTGDRHVHVLPVGVGASHGFGNVFVSRADDSSSLLRPSELPSKTFPRYG